MVGAWDRLVVPERDPGIRILFRLLARHYIHSHAMGMCKSLVVGLARPTYQWMLARGIAFARARAAKRIRPTAQEVLDGVVLSSVLGRTHTGDHPAEPSTDVLVRLFATHFELLVNHPHRFRERDRRVTVFMG